MSVRNILFFITSLVFCSCYTQKKAETQINKAIDEYPDLAAKVTREKFPCTTTRLDTLIKYQDSLIYIECPDSVDNVRDTLSIRVPYTVTKTVKVPVNLPVKTVYIKEKIEDSAKIKLAYLERDKAIDEAKKETKKAISEKDEAVKERDKWENKAEKRLKWVWWLLFICIAESIYIFRKPLFRIITSIF